MGLIGEMRKVGGRVSFGGRVAFCAQTAWIQNATLVSTTFCITTRFLMLFFRGRILPLDNHSKSIGHKITPNLISSAVLEGR